MLFSFNDWQLALISSQIDLNKCSEHKEKMIAQREKITINYTR